MSEACFGSVSEATTIDTRTLSALNQHTSSSLNTLIRRLQPQNQQHDERDKLNAECIRPIPPVVSLPPDPSQYASMPSRNHVLHARSQHLQRVIASARDEFTELRQVTEARFTQWAAIHAKQTDRYMFVEC